MRTTLTIDDDVAATLKGLRRVENKSLKLLINEALRRGLRELGSPPRQRKPFRTQPVSLGRCLIGDIVSTSETLALADGDDHK
jgi:hypothetical protein